jgi:hypothetical protein
MEQQMDLPLLMAVEFSKEWASTKHRYFTRMYTIRQAKDAGITVEIRSPVTDSWHHRNGYHALRQ